MGDVSAAAPARLGRATTNDTTMITKIMRC